MVSITVRALILTFAIGVCFAQDVKMSDSKCRYKGDEGERIAEECKKNFTECLEKVKPGVEMEMVKKNHSCLNKDEWDDVFRCTFEKKELIVGGTYDVNATIASVEKMDDTDEETKELLRKGIYKCAENMDATLKCDDIMACCMRKFKEVCFNGKNSDAEQ